MPHIDGPPEALSEPWSIEIGAFAAHWRSMREGAIMPTSERFLDQPSARFAANSYILDLTDEGAMVRYQGAELIERWMRDFTGKELHEGRHPTFKARSIANMHQVAGVPCGYVVRLTFSTSTGRKMRSNLLQLPLGAKPGRPPRIVCLASLEEARAYDETVAKYLETHSADWVDLGAGLPDGAPLDLLQDR
ncbi:MAG: hypothetical protein K2P94_16685 [Rhodospirillaceae bacterium]|nr:hypothetical protein [Rhodospirillaceae bacterium]